jgi:hypothetical protein
MKPPILAALILGSLRFASGATIDLSIAPPSTSVVTGQTVSFALLITGHTPGIAPSVGAFDLTVGFDQALLTPNAVAFGTFLGNPALFEAATSSVIMPSAVNVAEVSFLSSTALDALQPATFSLATLTFTAKASGTAMLTFTGGVVDDTFGNKLVSIPEPRTLWAIALPVLGMILGRKPWKIYAPRRSL